MLMPSIFVNTFMDDFFEFPKTHVTANYSTNGLMQTDVEETETGYEVSMNLPGFEKKDVKAELKEGYLTITASTSQNNDQKDKAGKYIRKERYSGTCSRSFYVGEDVTQQDIKARFENGVLRLSIPKKDAKPKVETPNYISIEG